MTSRDRLDTLLARHFRKEVRRHAESDGEAAGRVVAALSGPLPRQRRAWRLWPAALLDWDFSPAWPQLAALASCAVLGFALGVAGPLRLEHGPGLSARSEFGVVITAPEPLTGAIP